MSDLTPPGPPPGPTPSSTPPASAATGWLRLTLQGNALTSNMLTPTVLVNGYTVLSRYGENVIPVYAGPTRVEISCQWLRTYGEATLETVVPAGGTVTAYYAPPLHQFTKGAIGYDRQQRPGRLGFVISLLAILLLLTLLIVVPILV